ncbi:MAG TPA: fumarylacetoacetate hydrolase family protein [Polyangiaceae bacterium]
MRLATLREGTKDGVLVVVDQEGRFCARVPEVAATLQNALDDWARKEPALRSAAARLERGDLVGEAFDPRAASAPLPRAYEWIDGSSYLNHVVLVRKARGAEPPETLERDPLVYQGGSGVLLGPREPLVLPDPSFGLDFESEVAVVLGDVERGTTASEAAGCIRLVMIANDVTYRNLVPPELAKGFGFFVSKPATAFSPVAVTLDEFGSDFRGGRFQLRLRTTFNGRVVGDVETGPEMHFSFCDLVEHIAKTRSYTAGTILGSGTVSNRDEARGVSCLAERRARETIARGAPETAYMKVGDHVVIEAFDASGRSVFGSIEQTVVAP